MRPPTPNQLVFVWVVALVILGMWLWLVDWPLVLEQQSRIQEEQRTERARVLADLAAKDEHSEFFPELVERALSERGGGDILWAIADERVSEKVWAARQDAVVPLSATLAAFVALCLWSLAVVRTDEWKTRWIPEKKEYIRQTLPVYPICIAIGAWVWAEDGDSALLRWVAVGFGIVAGVLFGVQMWHARRNSST